MGTVTAVTQIPSVAVTTWRVPSWREKRRRRKRKGRRMRGRRRNIGRRLSKKRSHRYQCPPERGGGEGRIVDV